MKLRINPLFRLQFEPAQASWVLLYPEGMVKLNTSAAEILRRCDGRNSAAKIVTELETAFHRSELTGEVETFLRQAQEHGWVQA